MKIKFEDFHDFLTGPASGDACTDMVDTVLNIEKYSLITHKKPLVVTIKEIRDYLNKTVSASRAIDTLKKLNQVAIKIKKYEKENQFKDVCTKNLLIKLPL